MGRVFIENFLKKGIGWEKFSFFFFLETGSKWGSTKDGYDFKNMGECMHIVF
jgi:hypothetical protein